MSVTVLMAYRPGTRQVLEACFHSFFRHTQPGLADIRIIYDEKHELDIVDLLVEFNVRAFGYSVPEDFRGSYIHGCLLDQAVKTVDSEYLLTLDSDCFPVADGWLTDLIGMLEGGAAVAGILYPWQPIPSNMVKGNIERRIREKHCWNNTHVACQLVRTDFVRSHNLSYMPEDDTGFAIPVKAHALGLPVKGFMVTRGPLPNKGTKFDPEFNRHVCIIFGDKVYHHGGATQTVTGYKIDRDNLFSGAAQRVLDEKGAEWMLRGDSHSFRFDREEAVAEFKMAITYNEIVKYLQTHDRLFYQ